MLITLSRRTAIPKSVAEIVVTPLGDIDLILKKSSIFIFVEG